MTAKDPGAAAPPAWRAGIGSGAAWRDIVLLGLVSFIADVSGEMLSAVMPFFLVGQGATGLAIGLVDGVTEGVGDFFKFVGGQVGQRVRKTRALIATGYLVAATSRIGVALSTSWPLTLGLRSMDRVGKGLRAAPRDALLAGLVPRAQRARAFGFHVAADTAGGVVGVVLALALLGWAAVEEKTVVLVGAGIGLFAVLPLLWVRPRAASDGKEDGERLEPAADYGPFLLVATTFSLGRISYMFYVVHAATTVGMSFALGLYLLFIVVQAGTSIFWGRLGDRWGKRRALGFGYALFAASSAVMVGPSGIVPFAMAFALLGLGSGAVEGNSRALAAQLAGAGGRAARLGEYHAMTGFACLLAGIGAGLLWDNVDVHAAFLWGAIVPVLALVGLVWLRFRFPHRTGPPGH